MLKATLAFPTRASGIRRRRRRWAALFTALVLPLTAVPARAGDPRYLQYIESPYLYSVGIERIDPRATGVVTDALGVIGMLSRLSFVKYERTRLTLDVHGSHPLEMKKSPGASIADVDDPIELGPHRRELYAGNVRFRLGDYHMIDFGPVYSLTGNRYLQQFFLSYVQESLLDDDLENDQRGTADVDLDGRSYTELGHAFADTESPSRTGLRVSMKTTYRDGDEYQQLLEDDDDEFRWLATAELFYYREVLRDGQRPQNLLDPQPYPLEFPPVLTVHARLQEHFGRIGYDARSKGLQAVVSAIYSPEIMTFRPGPNLHVFPQVEEELRCGITGGDLDGICTSQTAPGYRIIVVRLRSPFGPLGFAKYFEGMEGDLGLRLKLEVEYDFVESAFDISVTPEAQLALRFY